MRLEFQQRGFTTSPQFVPAGELELLRRYYEAVMKSTENDHALRSDLSGASEMAGMEKIVQIMRPSSLQSELLEMETYAKALATAKVYLGNDMALDFDMLISKPPHSEAETPWHQDAAYWIRLPDKRAVSIWIALDATTLANGCMWFVPKRKNILRPHEQPTAGGALSCPPPEKDALACPIPAGGCTLHDGYTLHYSRGNSTSGQRRGLILNFRPAAMIALERQQGVDHTGRRKTRS